MVMARRAEGGWQPPGSWSRAFRFGPWRELRLLVCGIEPRVEFSAAFKFGVELGAE